VETEVILTCKKLFFKLHRSGFDFNSKDLLLELPSRLVKLQTAVAGNAPPTFKTNLMALLEKKITNQLFGALWLLLQHSNTCSSRKFVGDNVYF